MEENDKQRCWKSIQDQEFLGNGCPGVEQSGYRRHTYVDRTVMSAGVGIMLRGVEQAASNKNPIQDIHNEIDILLASNFLPDTFSLSVRDWRILAPG